VDTFGLILQGFQAGWELTLIERNDVNPNGEPRLGAHSLNAAGGLGLGLHYIHLCMLKTQCEHTHMHPNLEYIICGGRFASHTWSHTVPQ